MKNKKRFIKIILITALLAYGSSYFISEIVSKKIQQSVISMEYLKYNIQYLKDLHTLCVLDYTINPNGKEILKECKELEKQIIYTVEHVKENEIYYIFYEKYMK